MATKEQVDKEFWDNPELQQFIIPHVTVSRTEDGLNREENSGAYAVVKKVKYHFTYGDKPCTGLACTVHACASYFLVEATQHLTVSSVYITTTRYLSLVKFII